MEKEEVKAEIISAYFSGGTSTRKLGRRYGVSSSSWREYDGPAKSAKATRDAVER